MAQKIAIAFIALFGFANAGIVTGKTLRIEENSIEHRPVIGLAKGCCGGEKAVVVSKRQIVVVKEDNKNHHHDNNHVNAKSGKNQDSSSNSSSSQKGKGHGKENKQETSTQSDKSHGHEHKGQVVVRHIKTVRQHDHNDHHHHHKQPKIQVPNVQFNTLNYKDDSIGQIYKAPHTIVTVPRVHNVVDQPHQVAINERLGKSNCPTCDKDEKIGVKIQKKGDNKLARYDEILQIEIEAPIKKTQVKAQKVEQAQHRETNYDRFDHLHRHDYVAVAHPVVIVKGTQHNGQDHHYHDHDHQGHHEGHSEVRTVVKSDARSKILLVGSPARRVVADKVVINHGQDPRGEQTQHEHHGAQEPHRHNNDDNIDRASLPGQLHRADIRENTPLSIGAVKIKKNKKQYHH